MSIGHAFFALLRQFYSNACFSLNGVSNRDPIYFPLSSIMGREYFDIDS